MYQPVLETHEEVVAFDRCVIDNLLAGDEFGRRYACGGIVSLGGGAQSQSNAERRQFLQYVERVADDLRQTFETDETLLVVLADQWSQFGDGNRGLDLLKSRTVTVKILCDCWLNSIPHLQRFAAILASRLQTDVLHLRSNPVLDSKFVCEALRALRGTGPRMVVPVYSNRCGSLVEAVNDHLLSPVQSLLSGIWRISAATGEFGLNCDAGMAIHSWKRLGKLPGYVESLVCRSGGAIIQIPCGPTDDIPSNEGAIIGDCTNKVNSLLQDLDEWHFDLMLGVPQPLNETQQFVHPDSFPNNANNSPNLNTGLLKNAFRKAVEHLRGSYVWYRIRDDPPGVREHLQDLSLASDSTSFDFTASEWARLFWSIYRAYRRGIEPLRTQASTVLEPALLARIISFHDEAATGNWNLSEIRRALAGQVSVFGAERDRILFDERIAAQVRHRLKEPIRDRIHTEFSRLISVLFLRARLQENEADVDRLIDHGRAMATQWSVLATDDKLTEEWSKNVSVMCVQFLRRYNLFVSRSLHQGEPDHWNSHYQAYKDLLKFNSQINELGIRKQKVTSDLLTRASRDDPNGGQFGPIDAEAFRECWSLYRELEWQMESMHVLLLRSIRDQQMWMDKYGFEEPGEEMDLLERSSGTAQ